MDNTSGDFQVGAVITAFKIGPVLTDTINCVLAQRNVSLGSVVVVVDGCGYSRTTREICDRYARARPGLVNFIWLENGGVSRARNVGVNWTLQNNPETKGVFLIDGDDLIDPLVMSRCVASLLDAKRSKPDNRIGWTYSNQSQFGDDSPFTEYPKDFIPTRWLSNNLSQPSCLIDRSMFDAGVYWDEDMRRGIEDWEYWLTAIESGFTGAPSGNTYLRYRRLTGNRSSLNRSNDLITKEYMRTKHKSLFSIDQYLTDESAHFPRWAFMKPAPEYGFELCTDPAQDGKKVDRDHFLGILSKRLSLKGTAPCIVHPYFPDMIAFVDPADSTALSTLKRYHSTLLNVEKLLENNALVTLRLADNTSLTSGSVDTSQSTVPSQKKGTRDTAFTSFFVSVRKLVDISRGDGNTNRASDITDQLLQNRHRHLCINVDSSDALQPSALTFDRSATDWLDRLIGDFHRVVELPKATSHLHRDRHTTCGANCANHKELSSNVTGIWPLLPKLPDNGKLVIGALARDVDAAQVSAALDGILKIHDADSVEVKLAFVGNASESSTFATHPLVSSIAVVDADPTPRVPGNKGGYLGLPHFERMAADTRDHLVGLLAGSSIVLDFCGPEMAAVTFELKSKGAQCVLIMGDSISSTEERHGLHDDQQQASNNNGGLPDAVRQTDPVAVQAYGGAYRHILTGNDSQRTMLSSYGVPMSRFISNYDELLSGIAQ